MFQTLECHTLQCVVLTGRPTLDATTTVIAEASSMLNPLNWNKIYYYIFYYIIILCHEYQYMIYQNLSCNRIYSRYVAYLDGVMGVRSLPIVWITLLPHTHSPAQMPTPPYRSNQMGVGALDTTEPLSYRSQRATSGPIALLVIEISCVSLLNEQRIHAFHRGYHFHLPDIIPTVCKGAKARREYLEELKKQGNSWLVHLQLILVQSMVPASFLHHTRILN